MRLLNVLYKSKQTKLRLTSRQKDFVFVSVLF